MFDCAVAAWFRRGARPPESWPMTPIRTCPAVQHPARSCSRRQRHVISGAGWHRCNHCFCVRRSRAQVDRRRTERGSGVGAVDSARPAARSERCGASAQVVRPCPASHMVRPADPAPCLPRQGSPCWTSGDAGSPGRSTVPSGLLAVSRGAAAGSPPRRVRSASRAGMGPGGSLRRDDPEDHCRDQQSGEVEDQVSGAACGADDRRHTCAVTLPDTDDTQRGGGGCEDRRR